MADPGVGKRRLRQLSELKDVYDFLEEVRLRPGIWVRGSSLLHLHSLLTGYRIALGVHDVEETFDFWNPGNHIPFNEWLWKRLGMPYSSALGWAVEIERAAEKAGRPAMELFFELLDEFRAAVHGARHEVESQPGDHAPAEAEQPGPTVQN
ncbi:MULTISPECIES: hypothetical protein [unclassified Streptomyces]|uniref:hypothetical protein n=1 Tax=unclassified Streptomyces TaxID=2593676 RepID=UPI0007EDCD84|nr:MULTISPECIES: hypothetical protein [unclassified Streptomyces]MCP3768802.1 hypothetical protein [Streptomyces sp. MAR25Y5]OBQ48659.1 hypothetical protein A4U61_26720 [Streptomyces sp. H-KF8]